MVSTRRITNGVSPDKSGKAYSVASALDLAWPLFDDVADTKRGLLVDAYNVQHALAGDPPGTFKLQDRCGDRLFTPDPSGQRHPYVTLDSITGLPVLMFGAGGSDANVLSDAATGTLYAAPGLDAYNAGQNDSPLFMASQGFCVAFKARFPHIGTPMNGATYDISGGCVLGGAGSSAPGAAASPLIGVEESGGLLRIQNQFGVTSSGSYFTGASDLRTGAWTTVLIDWNAAAQTFTTWVNPVAGTDAPTGSRTAVTADIAAAVDSSNVPMIGGTGIFGGPNGRLSAALAMAAELPGGRFATPQARQLMINLMAAY